ncbi:MAG: DUF2520 domain-containing protein [Bacteroidia bacterium]|nr:DUF2520 domain-containing protein [Bacteroidia bacterium]
MAKNKKISITIIGAGNLGYHLAKQWYCNNADVIVVNHQKNKITSLLQKEKIPVKTNFQNIPPHSDYYVLCVKDDVIKTLVSKLQPLVSEKSVILHTSGAQPLALLSHFKYHGVLYPLYSFSFQEKKINWKNIPVFIVANHAYTQRKIKTITHLLHSKSISIITEQEKLRLHLLAVFANNFINAIAHAMYKLSQTHSNKHLYSDLLNFAIHTLQRNHHTNPALLQTGPAIRHDTITIKKHLEYLNDNDLIKQLYLCLTDYIQNAISHEIKR